MAERKYAFDQRDLERLDKQLQQIKKACEEMSAFSAERGHSGIGPQCRAY